MNPTSRVLVLRVIVHKSFKHGWFYHYRYHDPKTEALCNHSFSALRDYLHNVKEHCPDEYFEKGPRGSGLRIPLEIDMKRIRGHEVCDLASAALGFNKELSHYMTNHSRVQMFMLQHDDKTISVETPVWMTADELPNFEELMGSADALTGHIDALRVEDSRVWVWDYKPNAYRERFASTQVNFYSLMLSRRTGIPLEKFRCGYFDDELAFVFRPVEKFVSDRIESSESTALK